MANTRASVCLAGAAHQPGVAGHPPAHRRLRRLAGFGSTAGRAKSLRRCGYTPAARQSRSQGTCLRSACPLPLCPYLPGRRAVAIPTRRALIVRHALEPLPGTTLGAGMQRGMVHPNQMGRRSRQVIRGHR